MASSPGIGENREKKVSDMRSRLCEEGDEAWTGVDLKVRSLFMRIYVAAALMWIERMSQRGAGDSWERRSSWFCEWCAHVTGRLECAPLSGRVISPESESDKCLVRQANCLFVHG